MPNTNTSQAQHRWALPDTVALSDVPEVADLLVERTEIVVASWSMYPALRRGDRVTVRPLAGRTPQPGEIAVFRRETDWICHRITRVDMATDPPSCVTQGDAVRAPDPPVPLCQLIGTVTDVQRRAVRAAWCDGLRAGSWRLWYRWRTHVVTRWIDRARGIRLIRRCARLILQPHALLMIGAPVQDGSRFTRWVTYAQRASLFTSGAAPAELRIAVRCQQSTIGSLTLRQHGRGAWRIDNLTVRFRYRGCGFGARLLQAAIQWTREMGAQVVTAAVPSMPRAGRACYWRAGFRTYRTSARVAWMMHALTRSRHPQRDAAGERMLPMYRPARAPSLSREERILCALVWSDASAARAELTQLLSAPVDWWFLMEQMQEHRIGGMLLERVSHLSDAVIPPLIRQSARDCYYRQAIDATALMSMAAYAARLLDQAGIRLVALKGLGMVTRYYDDPAMRPMSDVDFLIDPAMLPMADRVLTRHGFARLRGAAQEAYTAPAAQGGGMLELHPPSEHPFYDAHGLYARAEPVNGEAYWMPAPEDVLLFSALHMTLHFVCARLIWLHDVARVIASGSVQWAIVAARMRDHPGRVAVYHALRAAQECCRVDVPADVLRALAPQPHDRLRNACLAWALSHPPIAGIGMFAQNFLGRASSGSLAGLRQRVLPSPQQMRQRFGPARRARLTGWYAKRMAHLVWSVLSICRRVLRAAWRDLYHA